MGTKGAGKYLEFLYNYSGTFYTALFNAIAFADKNNLERLAQGFPEEVAAFRAFSEEGPQAFVDLCPHNHPLLSKFKEEYDALLSKYPASVV